MQLGNAEQKREAQMPLSPQNGQSPDDNSEFQSCRSQELTSQVAAAYHCLPYRSLRSRRARQAANLPPYLRRRFIMEDDSWIQSISDFEENPHTQRMLLHDTSKAGIFVDNHLLHGRVDHDQHMFNHGSLLNSSASFFEPARQSTLVSTASCNSPIWSTQSAQFHADGQSPAVTAPMMSQSMFAGDFSGQAIPLSATSSCPPYLLSLNDGTGHQASQYSSHTQTNTQFSGMRTESTFPESAQGTAKPTLKIDTTSHSYFKENSGAVLQKWFSNTVDPVAPPQLYNVPPPASLASQDSYDDMVSVSSYPNSQTPPTSHPQTASDISSQLSFANMPTDYGMHSGVGHAMTTRGRRPLPDAPTCLSSSSTSSLSSFASASGYKRDAVSPKRYSDPDNNCGDSDEADQYNNVPYSSPSPTLVRRNKDRFLVTARKSGMTYRDIKVKGGFSEAESTLRGRYRTLTKHRSARVRKPEWTDKDISLLKRGVRKCCKDRDPQHVKIPWKTVAKYIDENGGSYLFGNATCRKKWDELNEE